MIKLNLPQYNFKFLKQENKTYIFDSFRKKYVFLTPEEWVRQNFLVYLVEEKGYKSSLVVVEASVKYNEMQKRCDAVIYDTSGKITMIVECKNTKVNLSQKTLDQAVRYNFPLQAKYLTITNGLAHYCCKIDYLEGKYEFLKTIPEYCV